MSELPVTVEVADEPGDVDKVLRITMSVDGGANIERFVEYLKEELQTPSHDTFKQHWHWRESSATAAEEQPQVRYSVGNVVGGEYVPVAFADGAPGEPVTFHIPDGEQPR